MMQSVGLVMSMMTFLILVVGGVLLAFRIYAGREYRHNHPASLDERGSDAVEDVALGHQQPGAIAAPQNP